MNRKLWNVVAGLGAVAMSAVWAGQAVAQTSEVKEKPALYTYVADWNFPRERWADVVKATASTDKVMDKALADGTIVGYGADETVVHQADGQTHDDWWSSMSLAGVLTVLDQIGKGGDSASSVLTSATEHRDNIYVSHYYNWKSGTLKDGYTYEGTYRLKPDAPESAVDLISKKLVAPLLEKLIADGTVQEYEVDTQELHTEAPGMFTIVYMVAHADGLDKVNAALDEAIKGDPMGSMAFASMVDMAAHHDDLAHTRATYK